MDTISNIHDEDRGRDPGEIEDERLYKRPEELF